MKRTELIKHLRSECYETKLKCEFCKISHKRKDFIDNEKHLCYLKIAELQKKKCLEMQEKTKQIDAVEMNLTTFCQVE